MIPQRIEIEDVIYVLVTAWNNKDKSDYCDFQRCIMACPKSGAHKYNSMILLTFVRQSGLLTKLLCTEQSQNRYNNVSKCIPSALHCLTVAVFTDES